MVEIQFPLADRLSDYLSRELGVVVGRGAFRGVKVAVKILPYIFCQDVPIEDISRVYRLTVNTNQDKDLAIGEYHININRIALTRSYLGLFPENSDGYQVSPSGLLISKTSTPHVFVTGDVKEELKRQVLELYQTEFSILVSHRLPHLPIGTIEYFWQVDLLDRNIFREYFEREREWWEENIGPFELVKDMGYHAYRTQYLEKPAEELLLFPSGYEDVENNTSYQQFLASCFRNLLKSVKINGTVLITRRTDVQFP